MSHSTIGTLLFLSDPYLQDERFRLITDSHELRALAATLGRHRSPYLAEATGALVNVADGDYREVWVTAFRAPYSLRTVYDRVV